MCLHKKKGRRGWKTVIEEVDLLFENEDGSECLESVGLLLRSEAK